MIHETSENEPIKRQHFGGLVTIHLSISKKYCSNRSPYFYLDMNAADGTGSPSIFYSKVVDRNIPFRAYFLELKRENVVMLNLTYGANESVTIYPGDHAHTAFAAVSDYQRDYGRGPAMGIVYHDPYGCISYDTLSKLSRDKRLSRVDFVIHAGATSPKRQGNSKTRLIDSLKDINKRHWLIREPSSAWQWTFLIGTNWADFPAWEKQHFVPLDSADGRRYAEIANETEQERRGKRQPPLIALQNLQRVSTASVVPRSARKGDRTVAGIVRAMWKAARH